MPRDAVSRTANVGTVGKNGLMPSIARCLEVASLQVNFKVEKNWQLEYVGKKI